MHDVTARSGNVNENENLVDIDIDKYLQRSVKSRGNGSSFLPFRSLLGLLDMPRGTTLCIERKKGLVLSVSFFLKSSSSYL